MQSPERTRTEADVARIATLVAEASKPESFEPGPSRKEYAYSLRSI